MGHKAALVLGERHSVADFSLYTNMSPVRDTDHFSLGYAVKLDLGHYYVSLLKQHL